MSNMFEIYTVSLQWMQRGKEIQFIFKLFLFSNTEEIHMLVYIVSTNEKNNNNKFNKNVILKRFFSAKSNSFCWQWQH